MLRGGVTGVSLLLCLASAVLWARCYRGPLASDDAGMLWKTDLSDERAHVQAIRFWSHKGALHVDWDGSTFEWASGARPQASWKQTSWQISREAGVGIVTAEAKPRGMLGFQFWGERRTTPESRTMTVVRVVRGASMPYWVLVGVFAVAPAVRFLAGRRREGRRVTGRCVECGYDLRGSPGRCPECGVISEQAANGQEIGGN